MVTMPEQSYVFNARLVKVVDGDTIDVDIDMGLHCHRLERLRLYRVNAPEMKLDTKAAGEAAKRFVVEWLAGWTLLVQTYKSDVFGRFLCECWRLDGHNLSDDLLASGHAVPFP